MRVKPRFRFIALTIVVGCTAIAVPIAASLYLAYRLAQQQEFAQLEVHAEDVMRRTMEGIRQIDDAIDELTSVPDAPCSEQSIARMRALDIGSSQLQALGYQQDNRLLCSSLGVHEGGIDLGEPDSTGASGLTPWRHVSLPFAPEKKFNVYGTSSGFVAIVHPQITLDVGIEQDVSLMLMRVKPPAVMQSRGYWPPGWEQRGEPVESGSRIVDGRLVVTVVDPSSRIAGLAASGSSTVHERMLALARVLAPVGAAAGLLLAIAVYLYARRQTSLVAALRAALRDREFHLVYQPLVELTGERCVGAEALLRWRRRDGQVIRPDIFVQAAEENGLIRQLTAQVLELVAAEFGPLLRSHPELHVGVNLASDDLQAADTVDRIRHLIEQSGARPHNFMIEATERGFLHADRARQVVSDIRALGVRVAIDDFGTGYSSLAYLERFELDFLKIDKSFVDTLGVQAATSQVALHIIEMAKSLRLQTIAEGVEQAAQAEFLRSRGVHYAQGWLFGKPMPIGEFAVYLDAQKQLAAGVPAAAQTA